MGEEEETLNLKEKENKSSSSLRVPLDQISVHPLTLRSQSWAGRSCYAVFFWYSQAIISEAALRCNSYLEMNRLSKEGKLHLKRRDAIWLHILRWKIPCVNTHIYFSWLTTESWSWNDSDIWPGYLGKSRSKFSQHSLASGVRGSKTGRWAMCMRHGNPHSESWWWLCESMTGVDVIHARERTCNEVYHHYSCLNHGM